MYSFIESGSERPNSGLGGWSEERSRPSSIQISSEIDLRKLFGASESGLDPWSGRR